MRPRVPQPEDAFCQRERVEEYDKLARSSMAPLHNHFAGCIRRTGIRKGRVLELGSGTGLLFLAVEKQKGLDFDWIGIDISREMAKKALDNIRQSGLENAAQFPVGTGSKLPFKDACFDLVISSSALHMWSGPVSVFDEIQRVLKEGGICLIRDSRRLPDNLFWRFFLWLSSRIMGLDGKQRRAWQGAVAAGYTLDEVRQILKKSRLQNWKVRIDSFIFELVIEAKKPV